MSTSKAAALQAGNTRERILDVAASLFYKNGYSATGVDVIAKSSGITKATLYHHFSDKEDIVASSMAYMSEFHKRSYQAAWDKKGLSDIQKLTVLFDEMESFFREDGFYGCPFINASGEFIDRASSARKISASHYKFLTDNLERFARNAGLKQPRVVAEKITGIIAGAYVSWHVAGISKSARNGKEIAIAIIKQSQQNV